MLEQKLEQDIKEALIARDSFRVTNLRGLKAVLLNIKVAKNKRQTGLSDEEVIEAFFKEAKKRQESADLYIQGGNKEKAEAELKEKDMIKSYLPTQLDENELSKIIDEAFDEIGEKGIRQMGQIVGMVKAKVGPGADGALIAKLTKEKLL